MSESGRAPATVVEFYWRPGCGWCSRLRRDLDRVGIPVREHNIWEDPEAAAAVRAAARGNETVPTVAVAGTFLVNPTVDQVTAAHSRSAPDSH